MGMELNLLTDHQGKDQGRGVNDQPPIHSSQCFWHGKLQRQQTQ